jgi:hypothetical protein
VVVGLGEVPHRGGQDLGGRRVVAGDRRRAGQRVHHLLPLGEHVVAPLLPGLRDGVEELPEVVTGEIGAAVERLAGRRHEHGHRPAALPGHRLGGLHVDRVDVGPLLAVHLDVDEQLVHQARGAVVLE